MASRPTIGWIPILSLAGLWGGVLAALPLIPMHSKLDLSIGNRGWSGVSQWTTLLVAGGGIGAAVGAASGLSLVVFRRMLWRLGLASVLGYVLALLAIALAYHSVMGGWPPLEFFRFLARGAAYFAPLLAACLVFAAELTLRHSASPWIWCKGLLIHAA